MDKCKKLRECIKTPGIVVVPGATDALTAKIIEKAGFDVIYATGAGISNTQFGLPDMGLITMTEMLERVKHIVDSVDVPVIADVDTGFGNAVNLIRTVKEFEAIGVAGIQIEDQVTPKKCGHFEGKSVIDTREMVKKIEAVVNHRKNNEFVIIARTDARAVYGLDEAISRGQAYFNAGADVIFIEAPVSREELQVIAEAIKAPLVANMVEGGVTPVLSVQELQELGYKMALFANTAMRVGAKAILDAMKVLKETGITSSLDKKMLSWEERQSLVGYPFYQELEKKYLILEG